MKPNKRENPSKPKINKEDIFDVSSDEEKEKIPVGEIQKLLTKIRFQNKYSLEETKTRNVLMVGRTRSGKSTAVGVLKDPCYEPKEMSIFSDTVDPKFQSFSLDDKTKNCKYTVNIIDTPGLKEVKQIGIDARSDEVIMSTINYCLKNEITKINTLLIFIAFELGVTEDDLNSFQSFLEKFAHDDIMIGVCITRSEDKPTQWKTNIENELGQHPYFSKILAKKNIKLCFIGCVDSIKYQTITKIDDLHKIFVKVYKMREELLKMIFDSERQVKLLDLPIAYGAKKSIIEVFEIQKNILNYLENITDYGVAAVKLKIKDFACNIDLMAASSAILFDPEIHILFEDMKVKMRQLIVRENPKMDQATKSSFIGKLVGV